MTLDLLEQPTSADQAPSEPRKPRRLRRREAHPFAPSITGVLGRGGIVTSAFRLMLFVVVLRSLGPVAAGVWALIEALRFVLEAPRHILQQRCRTLVRQGRENLEALELATINHRRTARWTFVAGILLMPWFTAWLGLPREQSVDMAIIPLLVVVECWLGTRQGTRTVQLSLFAPDALRRLQVFEGIALVALGMLWVSGHGLFGAACAVFAVRLVRECWLAWSFRESAVHASSGGTMSIIRDDLGNDAADSQSGGLPFAAIGRRLAAMPSVWFDIFVVGGVFGAATAGAYAAGAVPVVVLALILMVGCTQLARLAEPARPESLQTALRGCCSFAAMLGGAVAISHADLLTLLLTAQPDANPGLREVSGITMMFLASAVAIALPIRCLVHRLVSGGAAPSQRPHAVLRVAVHLIIASALALAGWPAGPSIAALAVAFAVEGLRGVRQIGGATRHEKGWDAQIWRTAADGLGIGVLLAAIAFGAAWIFEAPETRLIVTGLVVFVFGVGIFAASNRAKQRGAGPWAPAGERLALARQFEPMVWRREEPALVLVPLVAGDDPTALAQSVFSTMRQGWTALRVQLFATPDHSVAQRVVRAAKDERIGLTERTSANDGDVWDDEMRQSGASWCAFLEAGTVWTDDHLEQLLEACRTSGAELAYGLGLKDANSDTEMPVESSVVLCSMRTARALRFHPALTGEELVSRAHEAEVPVAACPARVLRAPRMVKSRAEEPAPQAQPR